MTCLCEQMAGEDILLSPTCIGNHWIFNHLEPADVRALTREALRKRSAPGEALFRQGDPADEMFLIKGGRIKLSKVLEDGTELTLDIRKSGDFIGENMFAEESRYPVSAYCLEDTLTCGFTRRQFEEMVLRHPKVGLQIIRNLSERINWLTMRVENLAVTNIEDRLYRVLTLVAREHGTLCPQGTVIPFPLTHEDMSFLIGAHRVSITRAMKALKESGKIVHRGKRLILTDLKRA